MKFVLALVLSLTFASVAFTAEDPSFGTAIDANNTITLNVSNNDTVALNCKYSLSWFENVTTFKRISGKFLLTVEKEVNLSFQNDIAAHLTKIHASVHCE
jgi:hypothetical protein